MLSCSIWFSALSFWVGGGRTAISAPHTRPTQQLSKPPHFKNLGAGTHMLKLNI